MFYMFFITWASVVLVCLGGQTSEDFLQMLPWATRDILLQLHSHLQLHQLTDRPIPFYRPDLGDEIAYWLITYDKDQFAIVSAGEHTGDSALLFQGEGSSPLKTVQEKAQAAGTECLSYTVLTPSPGLVLACNTLHGLIAERELATQNTASLWRKMQQKAADRKTKSHDLAPSAFFPVFAGHPGAFLTTGMRVVHIRPLVANGSDASVAALCRVLGVCDSEGRVLDHEVTEYGERFVRLEPRDGQEVTRDLQFQVVETGSDDRVVVRRFVLEPSHRARRQAVSYSIDFSQYMPDYNQFAITNCDAVGCGPVAWAQVLGYYDRRAHAGHGRPEPEALYRCSADGTTGSDTCQAPANMQTDSARIHGYITRMNGLLGTFCLFGNGATYQSHMDDVADFIKERLGFGAVHLHANGNIFTQLIGSYSDSIRDTAFGYIRAKWPVVVGFRVDGIFSQHYAVMTQYRSHVVHTTSGTETQYEMYLHMGWGGHNNGWRTAEMFMAAVAQF